MVAYFKFLYIYLEHGTCQQASHFKDGKCLTNMGAEIRDVSLTAFWCYINRGMTP
jgi:hypothetical protein